MKIVDCVIIGAGPGGLIIFEQLKALGLNTVLLEGGPKATADGLAPLFEKALWPYQSNYKGLLDWHRTHAVGGRTIGWGGFCFRFPAFTFENYHWPYSARSLAPYYAAAEAWIGMVEGTLLPGHRSGARHLGWSMVPLRGARVGTKIWSARNTSAARSAHTDHIACTLDHKNGRAIALNVRHPDGSVRQLQARSYILAAAPVESTRLLLASGLARTIPRLGQHLLRHPAVGFMLVEPRPLPKNLSKIELLDGGLLAFPEKGFAIEVVGPRPMTEILRDELIELNLPRFDIGKSQVTYINAMSETDSNPRCRISISRQEVDPLGRPIPKIHLSVTQGDKQRIAMMKEHCAAYAEAIAGPGAELFMMQDATPASHLFHEAGTCAMGIDSDSPCDPWGRLRALDNVWLADASVFPSAGDRHPTLTVLAHALRVARDVGRNLASK